MALSLNRITLIGNLGKDPETKNFSNGGKVVNFSVATSESWKDKHTGENREKTEWHKIAVFGDALADFCQKYLRKGSKIYLEGKLQTRKYQDNSGRDVYTTEVVVQGFDGKIISLESKSSRDDGQSSGGYGGGTQNGSSSSDYNSGGLSEDDLPF